MVNQVHGAVVHVIGQGKSGHDRRWLRKTRATMRWKRNRRRIPLVTDRTDVLLSIRVADCVPILLAGMESGCKCRCRVVAGIHAGCMRGGGRGVVGGTVEVLRDAAGELGRGG